MILGRVMGQVWATRKNTRLEGKKLLIIRPLTWYNPDVDTGHLVCVDTVGAQVGQDVVVCLGAPARWDLGDVRYPVEASVAAIVDRVEVYKDAMQGFSFAKGLQPADLETR